MGRNILTYTEAVYLIRELPDLLKQSIHNTRSTEKYQIIGAEIVALSGLGNKCLWVLRESTEADGRAANKFYEYEKTTLEDFATKYAKSRLTNSLNDLKEAFNMLNDTLNAEYNIENAKNYFSKTAEVKSDIADSSDSISFDKSSEPLKICDDQLKSSIDDHNTIMNQQQNLEQYIETNIHYQKKPIFGGGFPPHNTFGQTGAGFPPQPGFPNQGGFPTNTTNINDGLPKPPPQEGLFGQQPQFVTNFNPQFGSNLGPQFGNNFGPQQNQFQQFQQQLSPISLKINGQYIICLYEWKLFSQEEKIKYAEIYGNGSYCENTIICCLDNNTTDSNGQLYFIGRWSCLAVSNGKNYRYAILVSRNSELNIDEFNRTTAYTLSFKSLDKNNQDFIKKAYNIDQNQNATQQITNPYQQQPLDDNFGQQPQQQSNIGDQPSPSAVSSTNNTEEPEPASDSGFNQGNGTANTAETSVEVSPHKTDDKDKVKKYAEDCMNKIREGKMDSHSFDYTYKGKSIIITGEDLCNYYNYSDTHNPTVKDSETHKPTVKDFIIKLGIFSDKMNNKEVTITSKEDAYNKYSYLENILTKDDKEKIESWKKERQDLTKADYDYDNHDNHGKKSQKSDAIDNIFTKATGRFKKEIGKSNLAKKGFGRKFFKTVKEYVKIDKLVDDLITEIYDTTDFKGKIFNDVKKISDLEKIVNKKITSKDIGLSAKGLCLMGVAYAYADYIKTKNITEKIKTAKTILNQLPKTIKNLDRTGLRKTTLVTFIKQIKVLSEEVIKQYEWQQLT